MTPERFALVKHKLALRQPDLTVLMDQVHKPHNFSAVLRSCDAVGVDTAHAVVPEGGLPLANNTAQGAEKWVNVERYADIDEVATSLKAQGFKIYTAHLSNSAIDFRTADFTRPCAILLGAEKLGVSDAALKQTDQVLTIPMQGMVESLNVSVAAALMLFEAQRQRLLKRMYSKRRLSDELYQRRLVEWLHPRVAHHCRQHKLDFPELDQYGDVENGLKGTASNPF